MPFVECDTCAAKPGTPVLCSGCLKNRDTIARLEKEPAITCVLCEMVITDRKDCVHLRQDDLWICKNCRKESYDSLTSKG